MAQIKGKATINEIYDVLEQQKKLEEVKRVIMNSIEKVNITIKSITVENLQLSHSSIDEVKKDKDEDLTIKEEKVASTFTVNQQFLDIEIRHPENEEIESDEDLCRL